MTIRRCFTFGCRVVNKKAEEHIFNPVQIYINMAKDSQPDEVPRRRIEERPAALSQPLPREKLPKDLQSIVDKQDDVWEEIYDGQYAGPICR